MLYSFFLERGTVDVLFSRLPLLVRGIYSMYG